MSTQTPSFPNSLSNPNENRNYSLTSNKTQDIKSQTQPNFGNPTQTSPNIGSAVPGISQTIGGFSSPFNQNLGHQANRPLLGPQQIAAGVISGGPSNLPGTQTYIQGGQAHLLGGQRFINGQAPILGAQRYVQGTNLQGAIPSGNLQGPIQGAHQVGISGAHLQAAIPGVGGIPPKPASSSRVQYIPYDKTYTDYQIKQVYSSMWVPIQKKCLNYYAIEHITQYVPREVDDVRYELVPQQQINYRVQYTPVEKQIIHLPQYENIQYVSHSGNYGNGSGGVTYPTGSTGVYQYANQYGISNPKAGASAYGLNIPGYQPLATRFVGSSPKTNFVTTDGYVPSYLLPSYTPNSNYQPFLPKMPQNLSAQKQLDSLVTGQVNNQKMKNTLEKALWGDFNQGRGGNLSQGGGGDFNRGGNLSQGGGGDFNRGGNLSQGGGGDFNRGGGGDSQIQSSIFGFLKGRNSQNRFS